LSCRSQDRGLACCFLRILLKNAHRRADGSVLPSAPFIVAHLCVERALAVELSRGSIVAQTKKHFLESLGYEILTFSHRDVLAWPERVPARVRAALR